MFIGNVFKKIFKEHALVFDRIEKCLSSNTHSVKKLFKPEALKKEYVTFYFYRKTFESALNSQPVCLN
ncbi:hypothetical protein A2645_00100 [Candidatus Nomurabacteria bacterium RIFCSPHIGHO2_01_FULL_39_9]|uniref:Uncharacterized protein n=1 Tax=Candidatus Nomurabacteria bacterium RIFCSPHIGHO2_01_FULL_39_9 TaxID=1801735 RepID=A0A1F6UVR7_9BACT|nr:MAG: hypothetical protein A2645_00100 [Candidatus Nomurabacteria bacterium RIFCSPHIGHO2_01_FULL_39_9]